MTDPIGGLFDPQNPFSAADLASFLRAEPPAGRVETVRAILHESFRRFGRGSAAPRLESLQLSRIFHSLGSALLDGPARKKGEFSRLLAAVDSTLTGRERQWLASFGFLRPPLADPAAWASTAQNAAFDNISRTIVYTQTGRSSCPKNALRTDEIIWGRAPARLDLGGGWSDTPPYSLENGGCVINAAVDLNGQSPIQVFARVIPEPEIRINSIDHGSRLTIRAMDELLDYRSATSRFGLAKAALALSGFSPYAAPWPAGVRSLAAMLKLFGGGIELNTLAAIPSGSGLGTSSIMGAVLAAVINRMVGDRLSERELFHAVLKLEQELTTGGGWQDQIGGVLPGVKVISSGPGLVPDPWIHYVLPDLLDPGMNGGTTLLFYTGIRRLAKNILRYVVGNYLDRDPSALATLHDLHAYPVDMREAMSAKNHRRFGALIDVAWRLNKRIDPDSTTPEIEAILARIKPRIHGAKLLGAGGGGFLLIVGKTPKDAQAIRRTLTNNPPNPRARFFDYQINNQGLTVTVC